MKRNSSVQAALHWRWRASQAERWLYFSLVVIATAVALTAVGANLALLFWRMFGGLPT